MKAKLAINSVSIVATHFEPSQFLLLAAREIEVLAPAFHSCLAWYAKIDDLMDAQLKSFVVLLK